MKIGTVLFIIGALIVTARSSPMPQLYAVGDVQEDSNLSADADTTTSRPSRPTRPRPIITAFQSAAGAFSNAVTSAASSASNAFGSVANSGISVAANFAANTNDFINRTAQTMTETINSAAYSLNQMRPSTTSTTTISPPPQDPIYSG